MAKIYDFKAQTSKGKEIDFSQFQGKVLLVVNTASKCGFTPQFAGLEELNQKYKDKGLVIVGFPCNQFKEQDPAEDELWCDIPDYEEGRCQWPRCPAYLRVPEGSGSHRGVQRSES